MTASARTLTLDMVLAAKANIYQLDLWTFEAVEPPAFEALSPLRHYLNLSGIPSLTDDEAAAFARHPGILDLSGLREVSDSAASHLATKKGGLWLNGLPLLSDTAIRAFSAHEGDLYLWGIRELTPAQNKALSKHNIFFTRSHLVVREPVAAIEFVAAVRQGFAEIDRGERIPIEEIERELPS